MTDLYIGEFFAGSGPNAAHINVLVGPKSGPAGLIFGTALSNPKIGHVPFISVLQPGIPTKPLTAFVNKADIQGEVHGKATWGAAQAGVSMGVHDAVEQDVLPPEAFDEWVITACAWVDWAAQDLTVVYENNRKAVYEALRAAVLNLPTREQVDAASLNPNNPFYAA